MQALLEWIFTKRKRSFSAYVGTEDFSYVKLTSCKWNSISLTCSEGDLLQGSISFVSNRDFEIFQPTSAFFNTIFKNSNIVPYWQTGALKDNDVLRVVSWELGIAQNITPAYLNTEDFDLPAYFRIANWEFTISAQMLAGLNDYNKIQIGITDTLNPIILSAQSSINMSAAVSFGGIDAMGNYTYALELVGIPDSYDDSASTDEPFVLSFT
jgi:hypothetical protein